MPNEFLTFAGDPAANVMPQADYAAASFTTRLIGFSTGTALSPELNRVWRQSSIMTSMLGDFVVGEIGGDMLDDGTPAGMTALRTHFTAAIQKVAQRAVPTGNWLPISGGTLTGPLAIQVPGTWANLGLIRAAGQGAQIVAFTGNSWAAAGTRFDLILANQEAETGANAGSNASISRFSDTGAYLGSPIVINRATGRVDFEVAPTVKGDLLPYLPLAGGNLYGQMGAGGWGIAYHGVGWSSYMAFEWDGTFVDVAADGIFVGSLATVAWSQSQLGLYLPLSGGTVTGSVVVNQSLVVDSSAGFRSSVFFANAGDFINYTSGNYRVRQWGGNWADLFDVTTGWRIWQCYAPSGNQMQLSPSADLTTSGAITSGGGRLIAVSGVRDVSVTVWRSDLGKAYGMWCGDGCLWFGGVDGAGTPQVAFARMDNQGAFVAQGVIYSPVGISTAGSVVASQDLVAYGNGSIAGTLWVNGNEDVAGVLYAGVLVSRNQADIATRIDVRGGRIVSLSGADPCVSAFWTGGRCDGFWTDSRQMNFGACDGNGNPMSARFACSDSQFVVMPQIGFFANIQSFSDATLKENIRNAAPFDSLSAILDTPIVAFDWRHGGHVPYGFVAQDVEDTLPDAVTQSDEGLLAVDPLALITHLFRALRQMNDRLQRLEPRREA